MHSTFKVLNASNRKIVYTWVHARVDTQMMVDTLESAEPDNQKRVKLSSH